MTAKFNATYGRLDVVHGRKELRSRLIDGERVKVLIEATINPNTNTMNDDGTSIEFELEIAKIEEVRD